MSHSSHRIRLRRPWRCEPVEDASSQVRWRRVFHAPTGLRADTRITLVAEACGPGTAWLNGQRLGTLPGSFEIHGQLLPRNELVLELAGLPGVQGNEPAGEIALEIKEPESR